uniref:Putative ribonuclease H-like domain-containing protein n=1 Tax=Tanacetum cinerariifolium TaxID=118510 RepID=A0A6L2LQL0_TANCI|nr:putative ribonuclease H-like domain-containing protein [Tanacetum cinerariifolium]
MEGDDNNGDRLKSCNYTPPVSPQTQQIPHTVSSIKLHILKKQEYDIWVMKMKHYLYHTDYPIWQVIQNVNGSVSVTTNTHEMIKVLPLKTAEEVVARERERKARTTLLMALPEDHLARFHLMADAKEMFLTLLGQLEIHGAGVSNEDANQKFLRSLPFSWSQVALIMRTKPGLDTLSFNDLYNNRRVFERDVKATTASSTNTQNMVFVSGENTSSTNHVAMISMRIKSFTIGLEESCSLILRIQLVLIRPKWNASIAIKWGILLDTTELKGTEEMLGHVEEDAKNYAMMGYSSNNSGSDNEVQSCSQACAESYARLKKLYDDQRDKLGDASVEITAYTLSLKKVKAQLLCHQQNQLAYEQKIRLLNTQMSANDKFELGYRDYRFGSILSYENKVLQSVFMNKAGDLENTSVNDRYANGFHAVSSPMIGNYMPSGPDVEIDYSKFTYGLKQALADDSNSKASDYASCESDFRVEPFASMPKPVENKSKVDDPHKALKDKGIVDSGCSRHMTENKAHLANYQEFKGGSIAFGGSSGRITDKGKIKTGMLDFKDVCYVEELKDYNLFSVSQICDKKNKVLFTDTDCLVLSPDFKLPDENQVLLKIPRQHNMYSFNLKNIDPFGDLACLLAKASIDEFNKWHRRLGHVNFKNLNKLVKGNLVRGLPSKIFENDHTCVACQIGKQHKASCKVKTENKPNVAGKGHAWMFDLDYLTNSMNYEPVSIENQTNKSAGPKETNNSVGTQANDDQSANSKDIDLDEEYFVLPIWSVYSTTVKSSGDKLEKNSSFKTCEKPFSQVEQVFLEELEKLKSINLLNTASTPLSTAGLSRAFNDGALSYPDPFKIATQDDPSMPYLKDIYVSPSEVILTDSSYDDKGVVTEFNKLEATMNVSLTPTTRIYTIHPKTQILGDPNLAVQTRSKVNKNSKAHALISQALKDESWVDAMQDELLQFQFQKVWLLVDLPFGKKAIWTKWVYRNKKDEKGVVIRNKVRLVTQGHRQEEGINYDEVFASMARIEAIRIFLAFVSYIGFIVYQMDVKSIFLYGTIDEEVYVTQPLGFVDPKCPNKVFKVTKALYGLHQAPRAWYANLSNFFENSRYRRGAIDKTLFIKKEKKDIMLVQVYVDDIIFGSTKKSWCDEFEELMKNRFQMSSMGELTFFLRLQVKQKEYGIFISWDKYFAEILKKFHFLNVKTASNPIETQKPLVKDEEVADVDVHLYRSMIGSLIYLTAFKPDIMFAVYACSRFQVTSKTSHLHAVKRIFRYLKGQPELGLWYPKVSSFDLEAYSDSNYSGANLDKKSTTRGCQFLGRRLILWQCKK